MINLLQACHLFVERRPIQLNPEEGDVLQLVFRKLPLRKVLQVLRVGFWTTAETGEHLIHRGKRAAAIYLSVRGKLRLIRDEAL